LIHKISKINNNIKNKFIIFRPSFIFPDSKFGIGNTTDFNSLLISTSINSKLFPILKKIYIVNGTTVDFVSKIIIQIMESSLNNKELDIIQNIKCYNISNNEISYNNFINWIKEFGYIFSEIDLKDWKNQLKIIFKKKSQDIYLSNSSKYLEFVENLIEKEIENETETEKENFVYTTNNTLKEMKISKIPSFQKIEFFKYLKWLNKQNIIPPP
jgi:thioester reductase-like protein